MRVFNFLLLDKNFESAIHVVLAHEGLLTDNPSDPGGITNYGISLRFLRAAGIDENMNRSNHITEADIKALNPNKAKSIYKKYFWLKFNINKIKSLILATSVFDMAVLMGGNEAIELLQIALNKLIEKKINSDGILGQKTLSLLNDGNPLQINYAFKDQCRTHLLNLVEHNEKLKVFYEGWINRVNSL
jgi:lysozyme family protein